MVLKGCPQNTPGMIFLLNWLQSLFLSSTQTLRTCCLGATWTCPIITKYAPPQLRLVNCRAMTWVHPIPLAGHSHLFFYCSVFLFPTFKKQIWKLHPLFTLLFIPECSPSCEGSCSLQFMEKITEIQQLVKMQRRNEYGAPSHTLTTWLPHFRLGKYWRREGGKMVRAKRFAEFVLPRSDKEATTPWCLNGMTAWKDMHGDMVLDKPMWKAGRSKRPTPGKEVPATKECWAQENWSSGGTGPD